MLLICSFVHCFSSSSFFLRFFASNLFELLWEADSLEHLIRAPFNNWFFIHLDLVVVVRLIFLHYPLSSVLCAAYRFSGVPTKRIIMNRKTTHQTQSNSLNSETMTTNLSSLMHDLMERARGRERKNKNKIKKIVDLSQTLKPWKVH